MISLTVVLGIFLKAFAILQSLTAVVFLVQPVLCLLFRTLMVYFFSMAFHIVALAMHNNSPMSLVKFLLSPFENGLRFSYRQLFPHVGFTFLTTNTIFTGKTKAKTKWYCKFKQSIQKATSR